MRSPVRLARSHACTRTLPVPLSTLSRHTACSPFQTGEEQQRDSGSSRAASHRHATEDPDPGPQPRSAPGAPPPCSSPQHASSAPTVPSEPRAAGEGRRQRDTCQVKVTAPSQLRPPRLPLQSAFRPRTPRTRKARAAEQGPEATARPRGPARRQSVSRAPVPPLAPASPLTEHHTRAPWPQGKGPQGRGAANRRAINTPHSSKSNFNREKT